MKLLGVFLVFSCGLLAQDRKPESLPVQRVEITLERQIGAAWKPVDPGFVFENGDRIRFRFRANFDGFLYVMDYGTSGNYSLLFPRQDTGKDNKIESGKDYQIPATEAWFRIAGPPGYDIVYWMVSPLALANGALDLTVPPLPKPRRPAKILLPRCDDSIFRARGECIDSSAGPRNILEDEEIPENLKNLPGLIPRELVIMRKEENSLISSPVPLTGPVIYQFRLAHK